MAKTQLSFDQIKGNVVSVKDYGAVGDGVTDDSAAIQSAIDAVEAVGGGIVRFPMTSGGGDYRVSVTKGTNDKYGIKIDSSNVSLVAEDGVQLRRLSSDISTYAKSFPILLIGKPDSNLAGDQVSKIKIKGFTFVGEDTRHSISGSSVMDGRQAIWIKNAKNIRIIDCAFESIDSSAVWTQKPEEYDYENAAYYNTTKCYDVKILRNNFIAEEHSTNGRALLHAIAGTADRVSIINNNFEWCDVCISTGVSTYDDYDDLETDTFTSTNLGVSVKRVGKGYTIKGNTVYNSSEHCFYLSSMSMTCTGNTIIIDNPTVCNTGQIQTRGRQITISGNTLVGVAQAVNISTGSMDVSCTGNTINCVGDIASGVIQIASQGLTTFIDNRSDYWASYKPMQNIIVSNNTVTMPESSQTNGYFMRQYTDTSDANFNTDGQMQNVSISGNTINNARVFLYNLANLARRTEIQNNIIVGKPFTESGFTTGTTMNSLAVLLVDDSLDTVLNETNFSNNRIYGFEYILNDLGGAGANMRVPWGFRNNRMDYIKYFKTSAFLTPTVQSMFTGNNGNYFLDRTGWIGSFSVFNSLSDGTGSSGNKTMLAQVGAGDIRMYSDDAGTYDSL